MQVTLVKAGQLSKRLLFHGLVDLFRAPKSAARYWGRIVKTALYAAYNDTDVDVTEKSLGFPSLNIDQIIPDVESIPVSHIVYQDVYGDMPLHELMTLCRILRNHQPKIIFEFGTFLGGTTLQLAANSRADVYTLDLPPSAQKDYAEPGVRDLELDVYPDQPGIRFQDSPYKQKIHQLFADSKTFDFAPYRAKVDLVFVDGSHHYECVVRDTENALIMRAPGGIVVWHDCAPYALGVIQALKEFSEKIPLVHIAGTSLAILR